MYGDSSQHVGNRLIGLELDRTKSATPSPYFPKTPKPARIFKDFVRSSWDSFLLSRLSVPEPRSRVSSARA